MSVLLLKKARELAKRCDDELKVHGGFAPWQVRRIRSHIKENLGRTLRVKELARLCRVSPSHFARTFTRGFGCPPHKFVTRCRLERAKGLMLEGDSALCEIAAQCGFTDQAHLSRIFLKFVGVSPARWRRALASSSDNSRANGIPAPEGQKYDIRAGASEAAEGLTRKSRERLLDALRTDIPPATNLRELAAIAGLSRFHFSRQFKLAFGVTPMRFLENERMVRAQGMIREGQLSFSDIAMVLGYSEHSHFTRRFKASMGVTPTEFARAARLGDSTP